MLLGENVAFSKSENKTETLLRTNEYVFKAPSVRSPGVLERMRQFAIGTQRRSTGSSPSLAAMNSKQKVVIITP